MTDKIRGMNVGPTKAWERTYFPLKGSLTLWEMSKSDGKNNRIKKLGSKDVITAAAMFKYDILQVKGSMANGLGNPGMNTKHVFEPDNFALRPHEEGAKGPDNTWDIRLVVEHDNEDFKRKHRSTMLINQCPSQTWAWLRDLMWIGKLGATCDDAELNFGGDGFLKGIKDNDVATGGIERGVLALSWEKRGGHYTDGKRIAQLWHVLSIKAAGAAGIPGATTTDADCAAVTKGHGALRGDVPFHAGADLCPLAWGDAYETSGYIWTGKHWKHTLASLPPDYEPQLDPKSNQIMLPRKEDKGIWVYILKPPENTPTYGIPPLREFPPPAGAVVIDTKSLSSGAGGNGGGFTYGNFKAGLNTDEYLQIPIPEVGGPTDLRLLISWRPSVLLAGGDTIELAVVYKYIPPDGAIPAAPVMVTKQLTTADNPSVATKLQTLEWTIEDIANGPMKGGFVALQFFRRGREASDTFAGTFKQAGDARVHLKPRGVPGGGT